MSTQLTQQAVGAHLVGGILTPDTESAMRLVGGILGRHLRAIPDGETGDRRWWVGWQRGQLLALDGIEATGTEGTSDAEFRPMTALSVDSGLTELPARSIGYADAAEESYALFRRLRDEGAFPADMKFQVAVPTAAAAVVTWVRLEDQERFLPIYRTALVKEVGAIAEIVGDDLLLQYDVATEFAVLMKFAPSAGNISDEAEVLDGLRQEVAAIPDGVEFGLHLCYGDYEHRHFMTIEDLSLCVKIANAAGGGASFIHMPADRETGRDPKYFEPLADLKSFPHLSLGVIDYEGDQNRTEELIEAAVTGSGGMEFSVSTECGLARIDQRGPGGPTLEHLLELHARNAAALPGR